MSEFLKLAYELIAKIVYNVSEWVVNFIRGFVKVFFTGWVEYKMIVESYFSTLSIVGKILTVILVAILIAIPIALLVLLVRSIVLRIKLKADGDDNVVLYREIGRLNKQVLELMDEKNQILAMKVGANTASINNQYIGGSALISDTKTTTTIIDGETAAAAGVNVGGAVLGSASMSSGMGAATEYASLAASGAATGTQTSGPAGAEEGLNDPMSDAPVTSAVRPASQPALPATAFGMGAPLLGSGQPVPIAAGLNGQSLASAAAAAAAATVRARGKAEEELTNSIVRFPKLSLVDEKYADYEEPDFNYSVSLAEFTEGYRRFAASQLHLYYTPEIARRFVAGLASSHILILEGISGTGKTSLPYSFSRYIGNPATMVSVQPSFRDRSELLGYFNEFSKKFNETEFLRALYEAHYHEEPSLIVLDEMNLARIEYYFAEMLSVLEMPNTDEWVIDLVPTAWPGDPELMDGGKLKVSPKTWFIGTANSDDSTFTITDKVYDRAMPIELNERADPFECELEPRCHITTEYLEELFEKAKEDHPISDETMAKMIKMNNYLMTRFKLSFGNRIMKQMYDFIPVYVDCGGTELGGLDYILARKVLKKFESMNVSFVRDEIKNLIVYMEKIFGTDTMPDSIDYLNRIQNMY